MTSEVIIDAYNLIHRVADLRPYLDRSLEEAREQLITKLMALKAQKKVKLVAVFDGDRVFQKSKQNRGGVTLYFSVPPQKADEVIKILVQRSRNPRNITVVSSDNGIVQFIRQCGAESMRSEDFYTQYLALEEKYNQGDTPPSMSKKELEEWLNLFRERED